MSNQEAAIQLALRSYENREFRSLRQSAIHYGLSHTTLTARYHGRKVRSKTDIKSARLTRGEEESLVQWFRDLQQQWAPVGHVEMRALVTALCKAKGDLRPLGQNWRSRFQARFPELRYAKSSSMDRDRLQALDASTVSAFFEHFRRKVDTHQIEPQDIWNMDETGFQMGQIKGTHVVFDPTLGRPHSSLTGVTEWVTIIELISMTGEAGQPYLIQKGKAPETHWLPPNEQLPNWHFAWQAKGWIDNDLALDWLRQVFLPTTRREGKTRLLLLDNHSTHISGEFLLECMRPENNLQLCFIPSHSSHKLQPLDCGPFSPLANAYKRNL